MRKAILTNIFLILLPRDLRPPHRGFSLLKTVLKYLPKASVANERCDPLFEPNGKVLDPLEWIAKIYLAYS